MNRTLVLFHRFRDETGDAAAAAMLVLADALLHKDSKPLSVAEAARLRGVSKGAIYKLIDQGQLRAKRIGRTIRIAPEDLDAA